MTISWFMNAFTKSGEKEPLSKKLENALHADRRATRKILIVDDDDMLCELMKKKAAEFHAEIVSVGTIYHARVLFDQGDQFDGVILDARLTNGNGVALYADIMRRKLRIPVVFLTGYDGTAFRREVQTVGPAAVFTKDALFEGDFFVDLLEQFGVVRKANQEG